MIRTFTLGTTGIQVVATRTGQTVVVSLGQEQLSLTVVRAGAHEAVLALADDRMVKVFFHRNGKGGWQVHCQGRLTEVELLDPWTQSSAASPKQDGYEEVRAPIPGRVVEVVAVAGASVPPGGSLLVLEAMKMQNLITSSRGGVVREVKVSSGQAVEKGQLLALLEP